MSIGNKIYEFRTAKNLSQGDLAARLDVSRQSVSKWETDAAIPDLDKMIRMCDLFGVSLDKLVDREAETPVDPSRVVVVEHTRTTPPAKILGCILVPLAVLVFLAALLLEADEDSLAVLLPFCTAAFATGLICILAEKHVGYWCTWAGLVPLTAFLPMLAGVPFLSAALCTTVIIAALMIPAARKQSWDKPIPISQRKTLLIILGWIALIALYVLVLFQATRYPTLNIIVYYLAYHLIHGGLALLEIYTVRYVQSAKAANAK